MPNKSELLVLLKPDALKRRLVGAIIQRLENAGFQIQEIRSGIAKPSLIEKHYSHLKSRNLNAFHRNVIFLTEGPLIMLIVNGSCLAMRKLIGATEPTLAAPGTIRGDFSQDSIASAEQENRGLHNLIHASDSLESAQQEVTLWRSEF